MLLTGKKRLVRKRNKNQKTCLICAKLDLPVNSNSKVSNLSTNYKIKQFFEDDSKRKN